MSVGRAPRRHAAVALLVLGAATGAAPCRTHESVAVATAAVVALTVAVLGHASVRPRDDSTPPRR